MCDMFVKNMKVHMKLNHKGKKLKFCGFQHQSSLSPSKKSSLQLSEDKEKGKEWPKSAAQKKGLSSNSSDTNNELILEDPHGLGHTCGLCGKRFGGKRSMEYCKAHIEYNHTSTVFACDVCKKGFKCKKALRSHQTHVHVDCLTPAIKKEKRELGEKNPSNTLAVALLAAIDKDTIEGRMKIRKVDSIVTFEHDKIKIEVKAEIKEEPT